MASSSSSSSSTTLIERFYVTQRSLKEVQLRWSVKGDVDGQQEVQISVIDHTDGHRKLTCQRAAREDTKEDFYDLPSHLLVPGHRYELKIKLMSRDQSSADVDNEFDSKMQVHHTEMLNFRLGEYALRGPQCQLRCVASYYFTQSRKTINIANT